MMYFMKIVIAGGSGFVGQGLTDFYTQQGHEVIILTRKQSHRVGNVQYCQWLQPDAKPNELLENADAFINLAGVSLNEGRWTDERKEAIFKSRMQATTEIIRIIEELENKPKVLVNASAIGIYPTSKAAVYTESSTQKSADFLGRTVKKWEEIAKRAEAYGVRTVFTRFGVILGSGGGALKLMAMPYDFYIGGKLGSGMQWVSWVHIDDVVGAIDFVISDETISGPVNVTAPYPVRMEQFGKTIAEIKRKPHWFPTPAPLLKAALGEKSKMVLEGQNVKPTVLLEHGYTFHYPKLYDALSNLL